MKGTLLEALPMRERPAWRVSYWAEGCSVTELLAALIGGARQVETAQQVLARFGSLHLLARSNVEELMEVGGVGRQSAARLQAALEIGRRFQRGELGERPCVSTPADAASLLLPRLQHLDQEHMVVLLLDTRNRLIGEPVEVYHGSLDTSLIRVGEILRPAVRANAASVVVAHNHPSGQPDPSPEDVAVTRAIVEGGRLLDVQVLDHLIIGRGVYVSLKSRDLGFNGEGRGLR
jgi:DNA repair protein RadC